MSLSRRGFIIGLTSIVGRWIFPPSLFAAPSFKPIHVVLPPKPRQIFYKEGPKKGGTLLIIGGIHGNEPGAYKTVDILTNIEVARGRLILIPRSNFTSILANVRGYNGDMNRKFAFINKDDPDYPWVMWLKNHIKLEKADVVLSLHDGAGFHIRNKRAWGECIVIDKETYQGWPLYQTANWVVNQINKQVVSPLHKFAVYNTQTFHPHTSHAEQRKSLTYFTLTQAKKPAFCLEVSKQLPSLHLKVKYHLLMLKYFFNLYQVETKPSLDRIIVDLDKYFPKRPQFQISLRINETPVSIFGDRVIKVPARAELKVERIDGEKGVFISPYRINLNWKSFRVYNKLILKVKHDFETLGEIKFIVT